MKRLLILRHAKSSWDNTALADFDRPLAERGRRAAPVVARYLIRKGWRPDLVLCSSARRAKQTWELVAPVVEQSAEVRFERELYLVTPDRLLDRLRQLPTAVSTPMVVGHNPGLEATVRRLVGDGEAKARRRLAEKFPTAALAVIRLPIAGWAEIADGLGYLEQFATPKWLEKKASEA